MRKFHLHTPEYPHHHRTVVGTHHERTAQHIILDYLNLQGIRVPPASRRRWRRQARRRERISQETWEASPQPSSPAAANTPSTPTVTQSELPSGETPVILDLETPPMFGRRLLAAIERVWELERMQDTPHDAVSNNIDDWDCADPNPSSLGRAAEYASLLLDVFSRVKPVDDTQLTMVQKGLVENALMSVLEMTQQLRVLAVSVDEPLAPLPMADDPELSVYSGCIVCYAYVADMLLMPCRHLTLCEVCCDQIHERVRAEPGFSVMRCPVCRNEVLERVSPLCPTGGCNPRD